MRQRNGLMSIGIALIMLIFSLIATMVLTNISSNLYKNIVVMDEGKELQYRRIVVMSLKNAADYIEDSHTFVGVADSFINFTFSQSEYLVKTPENASFPAYTWDFPATASIAATNVSIPSTTTKSSFVELYTKYEKDDENYGIVVQYTQ